MKFAAPPSDKQLFFFHRSLLYPEALTMLCMISDILMGIFEPLEIAHKPLLLSMLKSKDLVLQLGYF